MVGRRASAYGGPVGGLHGCAAEPMVGRNRELARVAALLDDALAGRGRLVLCTGEAGIGKTRLAEEAAASAAAVGVAVAWARAADRNSSPPYGLWRLVLDEPAIRTGDGASSRPDLWAQVFGDAERPAPAEGADSGTAQRFALFAEVRRRLAQAAERSGLLLVLDDLQWADDASAALLADVVRQLRGTRILVFATCRDPAAPGEAGGGILPRLSADANTGRVDLRGLPADAVGDLLTAAGLPASPRQADEVHSETGGNPFLVRELARMLAEQGRDGPEPVPGRVLQATAYRLAQVSDPAREVLQVAAVAGNGFSAGVVAKMLDRPVLALLGPLDEGQSAGFVVPGDRPGEYRFSHALVRSAVAARLSAAEQRRLHAAAADAIEGLYEGDLRPHLAQIARHRVEGSWPGDRAAAVAACEAAAEVAADALAFEEAVRLYRLALSVGEGEIDDPQRSRLELGLATALYRSGNLPASQETAARVGRRAERQRDRLLLARTALVMEATGKSTGTPRSAVSASRRWPGTTCPLTSAPGCRPATPRPWCTALSTSGPARSAGTRWPPPRRRTTRSRSSTRSAPGSWPAAPPKGSPSGPCWPGGCWTPRTPRAAPGWRFGAGCGGSTPCSRPASCGWCSATWPISTSAWNGSATRWGGGTGRTAPPRSRWRPGVSPTRCGWPGSRTSCSATWGTRSPSAPTR